MGSKQMLGTTRHAQILKIWRPISRGPNTVTLNYICRIWIIKENNVRCRCQFSFQEIERILQKPKHRVSSLIIISSPKQQASWDMYKHCEGHNEEMF